MIVQAAGGETLVRLMRLDRREPVFDPAEWDDAEPPTEPEAPCGSAPSTEPR
jgi:hypothetical protein